MRPILRSDNEDLGVESLRSTVLRIAREDKERGKASAFAFLAYDFSNHTLRKILEDEVYWDTLNQLSGPHLSIFYLDSQDSHFKKQQEEQYARDIHRQQSQIGDGMGLLVPIVPKSLPIESANEFLREEFGLEESVSTPFLLFFQTDKDSVLDFFFVSLPDENIEASFLELKDHVWNAVDAISHLADYESSPETVFAILRDRVNGGRYLRMIKAKATTGLNLGSVVALVKFVADFLR